MTADDDGGAEGEPLVIYPIPALVALLLNREKAKGGPLTEDEVIALRDGCVAMAVPRDVARTMNEARGYADIDPEDCWAEWQRIRGTLTDD